jgi:hypothetical protein
MLGRGFGASFGKPRPPQVEITRVKRIDLRLSEQEQKRADVQVSPQETVGAVFERLCCQTLEFTEYEAPYGTVGCERGTVQGGIPSP